MLGACVQLAPDDDATLGERKLFTYLSSYIPARLLKCRGNEFCADIALTELAFIHIR